jgi:fructose-1,6-bisphosphatase/inositol monophosphatase family enzyme
LFIRSTAPPTSRRAFCVSIAYERRGRLELAVVLDALKRELKSRRGAAQRTADPRERDAIARLPLDRALLAIAFRYDQRAISV